LFRACLASFATFAATISSTTSRSCFSVQGRADATVDEETKLGSRAKPEIEARESRSDSEPFALGDPPGKEPRLARVDVPSRDATECAPEKKDAGSRLGLGFERTASSPNAGSCFGLGDAAAAVRDTVRDLSGPN
jgi:hypothetical protein